MRRLSSFCPVFLAVAGAIGCQQPVAPATASAAAMWQRMADWDGVWKRTTASLPSARRNVLATKGGEIVMDFYASYLLTHYVAQNDRCDAETRRIARSVVSLFKLHADGAVGYRGAGG